MILSNNFNKLSFHTHKPPKLLKSNNSTHLYSKERHKNQARTAKIKPRQQNLNSNPTYSKSTKNSHLLYSKSFLTPITTKLIPLLTQLLCIRYPPFIILSYDSNTLDSHTQIDAHKPLNSLKSNSSTHLFLKNDTKITEFPI